MQDPSRDWDYWLRLHRPMFVGPEWEVLFDLLQTSDAPVPRVVYRLRRAGSTAWFGGKDWQGPRWSAQHKQGRVYKSPKGAMHAAREVQKEHGVAVEIVPFCEIQAAPTTLR